MLQTAGLLALLSRALSAGFDDRISPAATALLLGCWVITETGLSPASPTGLSWTHRNSTSTRPLDLAQCYGRTRGGGGLPLAQPFLPLGPSASSTPVPWPRGSRDSFPASTDRSNHHLLLTA